MVKIVQLSLRNPDEIEKTVEKFQKEIKYEKCSICGKEELKVDKKLNRFNGGSIIAGNPTAHIECYLKKIKELGFMENGFKKDGVGYTFFSQTTGIEKLNLNEVGKIEINKNIFDNPIFPFIVITYDLELKHKNTLGITEKFKQELLKYKEVSEYEQ